MAERRIEGKIVAVYLRRENRNMPVGVTLRDPEVVSIGTREFLTGVSFLQNERHWAHGRRCHVAWDSVIAVYEFESEEAYRQAPWGRRRWFG